MKLIRFWLSAIAVLNRSVFASEEEEGRRFIGIFPQTSPTRHQLISGVGIPLGTPESITTGWVLKCQYFLPTSISDISPNFLEGILQQRKNRKRREIAIDPLTGKSYEQYSVEVKEIPVPNSTLIESNEIEDEFDDGDEDYWKDEEDAEYMNKLKTVEPLPVDEKFIEKGYNVVHSRWTTYKTLEKISQSHGFEGRPCVLRSICEAADAQFNHHSGILGELMHIVFTPSTTTEELSHHSDNEYFRAELLGREGAPCDRIFPECKQSILSVFTDVHNPMDTLKTLFSIKK